jgi:hypothetical protein
MSLYYVESIYGMVGIRRYSSDESAETKFRAEVGSYGYKLVRKATNLDVEWVRAMGGFVPDETLEDIAP